MQPSFTQSHQVSEIIALFAAMSIREAMSFEEASRKLKFKITSTSPAYQGARRVVARDKKCVIDSLRGFGFCRLDGEEIVKASDRHARKIRRIAKRGTEELNIALNHFNLTREQSAKATERLGRLGMINDLSRPIRSNRDGQEEFKALKPQGLSFK